MARPSERKVGQRAVGGWVALFLFLACSCQKACTSKHCIEDCELLDEDIHLNTHLNVAIKRHALMGHLLILKRIGILVQPRFPTFNYCMRTVPQTIPCLLPCDRNRFEMMSQRLHRALFRRSNSSAGDQSQMTLLRLLALSHIPFQMLVRLCRCHSARSLSFGC
jgi:hypothetical protein